MEKGGAETLMQHENLQLQGGTIRTKVVEEDARGQWNGKLLALPLAQRDDICQSL